MISIIISWNNRSEIKLSIPSLLCSAKALDGEVIIVNFGGNKKQLTSLLGDYKNLVKVVSVKSKQFNKTWAQNIGFHHAKHDYIFFCDCDIILNTNIIIKLHEYLRINKKCFATLSSVKETSINSRGGNNLSSFGYQLKLKINSGRTVSIIDNEEDSSSGTRNAPGLLMVHKNHFIKINGYNGRLFGWGWEDQDIICRLTLAANLKRFIFGSALHISHDSHSRMQSYNNFSDRWESRDRMFRNALFNYDNNDFSGTYLEDIKKFVVEASS